MTVRGAGGTVRLAMALADKLYGLIYRGKIVLSGSGAAEFFRGAALTADKAHRPRRLDEVGVVYKLTWFFFHHGVFYKADYLVTRGSAPDKVSQVVFGG